MQAAPMEHERAPEAPRESAPVHEPMAQRVEHAPPAVEPVVHASAPVAFHAVSEHDQVAAEEAHRPNRRRHQAVAANAQSQELQLVETQPGDATIAAPDQDLPRRTKPRRRRGGAASAEPLQMVETQGGGEPAQEDGAPTP